jgi:hypothetical protein
MEKANLAKVNSFSKSIEDELFLNIVSEWRFDEGSGNTTKDYSTWKESNIINIPSTTTGYGDNASYSGWVSEENCISGSCLHFNGTDLMYVNIPDTTYMPYFTLSVWVYNEYGNNSRHSMLRNYWEIVSKNICFWSYSFDNDYWRCSTNNKINYNEWTHIATVWDGSVITHYINGEIAWKDTNTSGGTSEKFYQIAGYSGRVMKGRLDELIIYNKNLSSAEINNIYLAGIENIYSKGSITKSEYINKISKK